MTPNITSHVLQLLPGPPTQRKPSDVRGDESMDFDCAGNLACMRGLLWGLIFEAVIIIGIALCWMLLTLIHHAFANLA